MHRNILYVLSVGIILGLTAQAHDQWQSFGSFGALGSLC